MKLWKLAAGMSFAAAAASAHADVDPAEVHDILQKNACLACHAVDKQVVGPAYRDVAEKHKDDADAADVVAQHIRLGSTGVWGQIPMPPNPGISDEDLAKVVEWVLAGAPD